MTLSHRTIGLILGIALPALMLLTGPPAGLAWPAWLTACLLVLMATWWATEAIPIPATSLLPLIVLPFGAAIIGHGEHADAIGVAALSPRAISGSYMDPIVLLLLGGFVIALGVERWHLHKRIALNIVDRVGTSPKALIFGFMLATAVLSMWISNTATSLMMVPIAISAAAALQDKEGKFTTAILLGVCYSASIGGVATPIGTPTNLIALKWLQEETGEGIGFGQWMTFGIPTATLLIPAAWWAVTRGLPKYQHGESMAASVHHDLLELGPIKTPEQRIAIVFGIIASMWVLRLPATKLLTSMGYPLLEAYGGQTDMMIALFGAVLVFLVPAGTEERRALMTWDEAVKLPWGVIILFGGGISLGKAMHATGLSDWIGTQMEMLSVFPPILIVGIMVLLVIFLTEVTSNVATMTTLSPIIGSLAVAVGAAPQSLFAPAAVAASCAFMLPVATAPNAVIYATGKVPISEMIRQGFRINLMGVVIITIVGFWIAPMVL
ncbi:anion transporter [Hyphomonas adhaerens MHS-3]|uniref:Anion transporter n=1 Tax=Hyphomonas adhaerens MHS-3 TaxID=1280949 RepID=A0A069E0I5_9PROT|nr:SLC13 family permease [Hyphomonas adhaerens]KCZ82875.1 anion transporter [Hyphomonas adhaerens MHS-3]